MAIVKEDIALTIEKAIAGDNSAFETIFNIYWNMAYFYCFKYLNNKSEAEEAAQDAFFALSRNISKLNDPRSFKAYFLRILTNTCHNVNKSRKNKNYKMMLSTDDFVRTLAEEREEFLPEAAMKQQEFKNEIISHIDSLPSKQREVMLLHFLNGLSQAEIAQVLDVKPSIVGNRLFHAKASLKQKLEKNGKAEVSCLVQHRLLWLPRLCWKK